MASLWAPPFCVPRADPAPVIPQAARPLGRHPEYYLHTPSLPAARCPLPALLSLWSLLMPGSSSYFLWGFLLGICKKSSSPWVLEVACVTSRSPTA